MKKKTLVTLALISMIVSATVVILLDYQSSLTTTLRKLNRDDGELFLLLAGIIFLLVGLRLRKPPSCPHCHADGSNLDRLEEGIFKCRLCGGYVACDD